MSIIAGILYGLFSGIAEFLPISSHAHQSMLLQLCGKTSRDPMQDLLVHISVLVALLVFFRTTLSKLHTDRKSMSQRRKRGASGQKTAFESRLLRTAAVPLIIGSLAYSATVRLEGNLLVLSGFLIVNGIVLLLAEHIRHGNRDSSAMSGLDGILMGTLGALSCFPGLSRTGIITSYAVGRGADPHHAANWAVLLGIPAMIAAIVLDIIFLVSSGLGAISIDVVAVYFLSAAAAFAGSYIGMSFLRIILARSGFSGFAYYSLGAAIFSFVLYLITW